MKSIENCFKIFSIHTHDKQRNTRETALTYNFIRLNYTPVLQNTIVEYTFSELKRQLTYPVNE